MGRFRRGCRSGGPHALAVLALVAVSACSLGTDAPEKPGTARVRIEGSTPHPLMLITGREVYEQIDPLNGTVTPRLEDPDTLHITLPFDVTLNIARTGCVYVELRNLLVPVASVRMRVDLDNGESYDRSATLSDDAALIYYYLTGPSAFW